MNGDAPLPCNTCQWAGYHGMYCYNAACTTSQLNVYNGVMTQTYLTLPMARDVSGPCGPEADLWEAIPDTRVSYPPQYIVGSYSPSMLSYATSRKTPAILVAPRARARR